MNAWPQWAAGIAAGIAGVLLLVLWSVRRHRPPSLGMACEGDMASLTDSLAGLSLGTVVPGNAVELVLDDAFFDAVEEQIGAARHTVHLENFLWKKGVVATRMTTALCKAARRGVCVRVLLDGMGGRRMGRAARRALRAAGCRVAFFHRWSLRNLGVLTDRDHRKLVITDGHTALVGGHCYTDAWLGDHIPATEQLPAYDVSVRVRGPIVHTLQGAFSENWAGETGELFAGDAVFPPLQPAGAIAMHAAYAKPERSAPAVKILHHAAICMAHRRIQVQNPYFIPKPEAIDAFGAAVRRGVEVRVLMPAIDATDNPVVNLAARRNFGKLLRCGVQLFECHKGLIHQKVMTIDGSWSAVGSSNFDDRSFDTNDELTLGILDDGVARQLDALFERLLRSARPVSLQEWEHRPLHRRLQEHACYSLRQVL
ncbi:phospholipase D-like domain-containing protein [Pseudorhodoferax soli]|uniref:Cardiolipin synthase n=1 Tax=Pseudorhodoferax soli TaxID=545864 RepID=A0A368X9U9_9BURK|nr:phospholipase D-like domain-containing protein [Pseudorhodoferax soli]RCW64720.1 cardiolipin synthase [Pseudorhodoferax soli]